MSLPRKRLGAMLVVLLACAWASLNVYAATPPPSTWVALPPLPGQGPSPIFAIGVSPINNQVLVAGNATGSLLRSTDGGLSWKSTHSGGTSLLTIAFSPFKPGVVFAGTQKSGALVSRDDGLTWTAVRGLEGLSVRAFGFALTLVAAGTDHGVYISPDGVTWRQSSLSNTSIGSLAVSAIHDPVRLVAGSDAALASGGVPLYQSTDGGITWAQLRAAITGKQVSSLAAGPLPPRVNVRPLIVGTNGGLFTSRDNGASFTPNSGGGLLPSTDYTRIVFITNHYDRYYAASDGGGSASGGLWRTTDGGRSFTSLAPPMPSVTALAVSNNEGPILYVATLRTADHVPALWAYHDTGGTPKGPPATITPSASGSRTSAPARAQAAGLIQLLQSSRMPYIAVGLVALIVIGLAVVSHFRGRRG